MTEMKTISNRVVRAFQRHLFP